MFYFEFRQVQFGGTSRQEANAGSSRSKTNREAFPDPAASTRDQDTLLF